LTPQKVWFDALGMTYSATVYGVSLGVSYPEVLKWLPECRMILNTPELPDGEFYDAVYAATHVVYTLNDYGAFNISPRWLPDEHRFLTTNIGRAMDCGDCDMIGEFLDALKAFGHSDDSTLLQPAIDFLLTSQNSDGSWGDKDSADCVDLIHATWTAIDGLRDYTWQGERLSFPELMPLLTGWAES